MHKLVSQLVVYRNLPADNLLEPLADICAVYAPGHASVRGVLKANLVFIILSFVVMLTLVYPLASKIIALP